MILLTRHDAFTDVSTEPQYPPGSLAFEGPYEHKSFTDRAAALAAYPGGRIWRYVKNDGATAWVAGNPVTQKGSADTKYECEKAPVGSIAQIVVGIAQVAVPVASYSWVVREGDCEVLAGAVALVAGDAIAVSGATLGTVITVLALDSSSTANLATSLGSNLRAFGFAREAGTSVISRCHVNCQG